MLRGRGKSLEWVYSYYVVCWSWVKIFQINREGMW